MPAARTHSAVSALGLVPYEGTRSKRQPARWRVGIVVHWKHFRVQGSSYLEFHSPGVKVVSLEILLFRTITNAGAFHHRKITITKIFF